MLDLLILSKNIKKNKENCFKNHQNYTAVVFTVAKTQKSLGRR